MHIANNILKYKICHRVVLLHSRNLSGSRDTGTENVSHTLVLPSQALCKTLRQFSVPHLGGVMYQGELLKTLCKMMQNDVSQLHTCGNTVCLQRLQQYVNDYITIRIHYALEISNIGMTHGQKRNRKMLKLCHE